MGLGGLPPSVVNAGLAFALALGILAVGAYLLSKRLVARGRVLLAVALPGAWLTAIVGIDLLAEAVVGLLSPTSESVAIVAVHLGPLVLAAAFALGLLVSWRGWGWALVAVPLLLFAASAFVRQSGIGPDGILPGESPATFWSQVLAASGFLVAAAVIPPAAAHLAGRRGWLRLASSLLLAAFLLLPGVVAVPTLVDGRTQLRPAEFHVALAVEPEGASEYALMLPFFGVNGTGEGILAAVRDRMHVTSGNATFRWVNGTALEIRGRGPVTLAADYAFYGTGRHGGAFTAASLPTRFVELAEGAPPPLTVSYRVSARGVGDHTCSMGGEAEAFFRTPGRAPLRKPDEGGPEGQWGWPVLC